MSLGNTSLAVILSASKTKNTFISTDPFSGDGSEPVPSHEQVICALTAKELDPGQENGF